MHILLLVNIAPSDGQQLLTSIPLESCYILKGSTLKDLNSKHLLKKASEIPQQLDGGLFEYHASRPVGNRLLTKPLRGNANATLFVQSPFISSLAILHTPGRKIP